MKIEKKKGQVTLFVILGLVIVIIIGLAIYFTSGSEKNKFTRPDINIDEKYAPVQQYVEQCVNQLLMEGITKLGEHGGYIDPDDVSMSGRFFDINSIAQYDSDAAFLSSFDSEGAIVYWVHTTESSECENCIIETNTPSIANMESQLSIYIKNNLQPCLNNYNLFNELGYLVVDSKNYSVDVSISDLGVAAILETDVYVRVGTDEGKLEIFYTETDLPLKKYYEMASIIAIKEIETNYLENVGLYLLNTHTGLDSDKLPPLSDIQEGYNVVYWSETATRKNFEGLLTSYVSALRIPNTKNDFDIDYARLNPSEKYFYNATSLDIFEGTNLETTEVSFIYPGQDIYLDIVPSDGELIKPLTYEPADFSFMFKGRTMNSYNFYYAISYPVIVEIRDEYKPGSTYSFLFAMEGSIIDNLRLKDYYNNSLNQIYWDESFVTTTYNEPDNNDVDTSRYNLDSKFNNEVSNSASSTPAFGNSGISNTNTQFCKENQRTSGDVVFRTYDSVTGNSLDDVRVSFTCGSFVQCNIGGSEYDESLSESVFEEKFPVCKNGYMRLSKQGYLPKNIILSTDNKNEQNFGAVYLDPIITKDFVIQKYDVKKTVLSYSGQYTLSVVDNPVDVTENETIIISMERVPQTITEEPYATTAVISKDFGSTDRVLKLTPGTYALRIQLLDAEGFIIPKECKAVCVEEDFVDNLLGNCNDYEYLPKDNIEIKPAPWGGIDFTNRTLVHISPQDLANENSILELKLIRIPDPACLDDMKDISEIGSLSQKYGSILLPEFVVKE